MPRALIPSPFQQKITLLDAIKAQIDLDGPTGLLVVMLANKGIDIDADVATGVIAMAYDTSFKALRKTSQNLRQQSKAAIKKISKDTTGSFQNLKSLFEPNFKSVGDWGATISDSGKFTYPTDSVGWMDLFSLMKTKNDSYISPAISPLLSYVTTNNISLTGNATNGAAALVKQTDSATATLNSETARQKRDSEFAPVLAHIRAIVKFLKKLYPNNVKMLGAYGITVILSKKVAKIRKVRIFAGLSKLKVKLVLNSIVSITGNAGIKIYKGKTISGTPILLGPGTKWTTIKGYSIVCMENASTTENAYLSIIPQ